MKVSVIIPAYNCRERLETVLASLEKQDLPLHEFEVVVIDDGCSDGTDDFLRNYSGALNLQPLFNSKNLGRAKSRNRGIAAARNQTVIFLDADIEVPANFIRIHLEAQSRREAVYVGKVVFHPSLPKSGLMRYLEGRGAAKSNVSREIPGRYFISGNASAPLKALGKAGGFDEGFLHYGGEDLELGVKLARELPVYSLPEAVGYHLHHRELDEFLEMVRGYGEFSLPRLFQLHPWLRQELKLDHDRIRTPRDLAISAVCTAPIYQAVKAFLKGGILPDILYKYLIFRQYREGLHKAETMKQ